MEPPMNIGGDDCDLVLYRIRQVELQWSRR